MNFAYADPPYLGMGKLYDHLHAQARIWDDPEQHRRLIERLSDEWPDGWALSLHVPSIRTILPMCPSDVRFCVWVKPWAIFKPGVPIAYAWEPLILRGGRPRTRQQPTVRDWVAANVTLKRGTPGAKPRKFSRWVFDLLNAQPGDQLSDLFPGSGAVSAAWAEYTHEIAPPLTLNLEAA